MGEKIGVGLIGYEVGRSWAAVAHVPALRGLADDFEIVAAATSRQESADAAAAELGLSKGYAPADGLINDPAVDLVSVTVKVPYHFELVKKAIAAGKHVYCEWPLGNGLAEAEEMARLAEQAGVIAVVGLQARCAPVIQYVKQLVADGYVGEVLSSTMIGSGMMWADWVNNPNVYLLDKSNGALLQTIPMGHSVDAMCFCLGDFTEVSATFGMLQTKVTNIDTGEVLTGRTSEDRVAFTGRLASGAVVDVHYRGGASRGTNFLWEINGSKGDLQVTAESGHAQMFDLSLFGGQGDDKGLSPMAVPVDHRWIPSSIQAFGVNVAQMYALMAKDIRDGTRSAPSFADAVVRHRMLDALEKSAAEGRRVAIG